MQSAGKCASFCSPASRKLTCCPTWRLPCCAAGGGSDGGAAPTPLSQAGFKRLVPGKGQCLTLLSVEITADCRCRTGHCIANLHNRHCQSCSMLALTAADYLSAISEPAQLDSNLIAALLEPPASGLINTWVLKCAGGGCCRTRGTMRCG